MSTEVQQAVKGFCVFEKVNVNDSSETFWTSFFWHVSAICKIVFLFCRCVRSVPLWTAVVFPVVFQKGLCVSILSLKKCKSKLTNVPLLVSNVYINTMNRKFCDVSNLLSCAQVLHCHIQIQVEYLMKIYKFIIGVMHNLVCIFIYANRIRLIHT